MRSRSTLSRLLVRLRRIIRNDLILLSLLAVLIGGIAGYGAIAFRIAIGLVQQGAFGFASERVYTLASALPWWQVVLAPTIGGLAVGLFIHLTMPGRRPQGVATVMEVSALTGARLPLRAGIATAIASAASIGVGASVGREGPVVHLGATLASWFGQRLHLSAPLLRTLLGCGVASAVAASFNAPIAGVFFAIEVVIGHYALSAFAPIVVASVTGTIISRLHYGDFPAFILPSYSIQSFLEFPAFALLGIVCAGISILFMRGVFLVEDTFEKFGGALRLPRWSWPGIGGLIVGLIAIPFPHVLGVGYEATDAALKELLPLWLLIALVVAKLAATAISLGAGFSGGVFSPALFMGAMAGGAFGIVASSAVPDLASGHGAYTMVGMGAVAGAVLGAPISSILIIFEMTGDYEVTLAVMVGVVTASAVTSEVVGKSFFTWQLERRDITLKGGREIGILGSVRVADVMRDRYAAITPETPVNDIADILRTAPYGEIFVVDGDRRLIGIITITDLSEPLIEAGAGTASLTAADIARRDTPILKADDDLHEAMRLMDLSGESHLPVVDDMGRRVVVGFIHERDVMLAYHRAILRARAEERGETGYRQR